MSAPYRVEPVGASCDQCGQKDVYDIIGPDLRALGFNGSRDVSQCFANDLNRAFEAGVASVTTIRCVAHIHVTAFNSAEAKGGECAACVHDEALRAFALDLEECARQHEVLHEEREATVLRWVVAQARARMAEGRL